MNAHIFENSYGEKPHRDEAKCNRDGVLNNYNKIEIFRKTYFQIKSKWKNNRQKNKRRNHSLLEADQDAFVLQKIDEVKAENKNRKIVQDGKRNWLSGNKTKEIKIEEVDYRSNKTEQIKTENKNKKQKQAGLTGRNGEKEHGRDSNL